MEKKTAFRATGNVTKICARYARVWRRARLKVLVNAMKNQTRNLEEIEYIAHVPKDLQSSILSNVAKQSEKVGRSAAKVLRRPFSVAEVTSFLQSTGIPCFKGSWSAENHLLSQFLYRSMCPSVPLLFCCDYWREAGKGIVAGLNSSIELARHRSLGHGDDECFDYVFHTPMVNRRRGAVPSYLKKYITNLAKELEHGGVDLGAEGYSERTLFFRLEGIHHPLSKSERGHSVSHVKERILAKFPDLTLVDATPVTAIPGSGQDAFVIGEN